MVFLSMKSSIFYTECIITELVVKRYGSDLTIVYKDDNFKYINQKLTFN